eukprot:scaffold24951_cov107-Isochrysis_galbana.AAC.1
MAFVLKDTGATRACVLVRSLRLPRRHAPVRSLSRLHPMRHLCVCPCGLLPLSVAARPPRVVSYTGSFFAGAFDALPDPHPGAPLASSSSFSRYSTSSCCHVASLSLRAICGL